MFGQSSHSSFFALDTNRCNANQFRRESIHRGRMPPHVFILPNLLRGGTKGNLQHDFSQCPRGDGQLGVTANQRVQPTRHHVTPIGLLARNAWEDVPWTKCHESAKPLTTGSMVQIYLHSRAMNFTKSPNHFTKSGLRVFGFCPAGSTMGRRISVGLTD